MNFFSIYIEKIFCIELAFLYSIFFYSLLFFFLILVLFIKNIKNLLQVIINVILNVNFIRF